MPTPTKYVKGFKRTDIVHHVTAIRTIDLWDYVDTTQSPPRVPKHFAFRIDSVSTDDIMIAFVSLADATTIATAGYDASGVSDALPFAPGENVKLDLDPGVRYVSMWCPTLGGTATIRGGVIFA